MDIDRLNRGEDRSLVQGVVNFLGTDVKTVQNWGLVGVDFARGSATTNGHVEIRGQWKRYCSIGGR
ncbi:hypothetical protein [Massilibacterium senegalense]|uniref:hypothetical protein n=1 Tax=Massilibacterium senegalense TaxID=1632858 RepID=UPI0011C81A63|nr:hypothetical protein [Massilibacterium senegalense]